MTLKVSDNAQNLMKQLNTSHYLCMISQGGKDSFLFRCPTQKPNDALYIQMKGPEPDKQIKELQRLLDLHLNHFLGCKRLKLSDFKEGHDIIDKSSEGITIFDDSYEFAMINCPNNHQDGQASLKDNNETVRDRLLTQHFSDNPDCRKKGAILRNGEPAKEIWKKI